MEEPPLKKVASTPTIPSPDPQPLCQYLTSTPPPPLSKKRSSDEAGNDDAEIRIANPQDNLSANYPHNTILTPSHRPTKKTKISPNFQVNIPSVTPLLQKPQQIQPYQQTLQLSARQQDILQHLPPSQLLLNTTAYLSEQEPLLAPPLSVGKKRAWDDNATDESWELKDLDGSMFKKPRIERGKLD